MPRNKYPEETIQKILEVSLELFKEKGYEQTTIMEIVDNLGGMTKGAFYHHFKSKEDVLCALNNSMFFGDNPFDKIKKEKGLNGLQKARKALMVQTQSNDEQNLTIYIANLSLLKSPRFLMEHIKTTREYTVGIFQSYIEEGIADGSIKENNPKILADMMLLFINIWLMPTIYPCGKQEIIDKVIYVKDVLEYLGFPLFDSVVYDSIMSMVEVMGFE